MGVPRQAVQRGDDRGECRAMVAVLLPAVQHELVQGLGAVHRGREAVALVHGTDHLIRANRNQF